MAQVQNMWALNGSENMQGSVTYSMDRENQVSEMFLVSLGLKYSRKISVQQNFQFSKLCSEI